MYVQYVLCSLEWSFDVGELWRFEVECRVEGFVELYLIQWQWSSVCVEELKGGDTSLIAMLYFLSLGVIRGQKHDSYSRLSGV